MAEQPFERIRGYYRDLVQKYGHDPRACDYGQQASQAAKFAVIAGAVKTGEERVLDIGCGFADFLGYLRERHPGIRYTGLDISEAMVAEARKLHPGADIRLGNFLEQRIEERFDLVTANGIFYLLGAEAQPLMRRMVTAMFELSTRTVAFNSLSTWAPDPQPGEFYADPQETLDWCRALTPWVSLRHDYHSRDFTVFLHRERQA